MQCGIVMLRCSLHPATQYVMRHSDVQMTSFGTDHNLGQLRVDEIVGGSAEPLGIKCGSEKTWYKKGQCNVDLFEQLSFHPDIIHLQTILRCQLTYLFCTS